MSFDSKDNLACGVDFSDLMDGEFAHGVERMLSAHGIDTLSDEAIAKLAAKQEGAKRSAAMLMELSQIFMERLDDVRTVDELKSFSEAYFEIILPDLIQEAGLDAEKSNVVKLLKGLEQELSTLWSGSALCTDEFCLKSAKFDSIKRIFANFVMMLGMVKNEGNWEDLEAGVYDIIGISSKEDREIAELEVALAVEQCRMRVTEVLLGEMILDENLIKQRKLEAFANGDVSLYRLEKENLRHREIMECVKEIVVDLRLN